MNIVIAGNGRVATHLANILFEKGHCILQILGRNMQRATVLAKEVDAAAIVDIDNLHSNTELLILAIPDDVLVNHYVSAINPDILVVHTSGSVPLNALHQHQRSGIFYPLQTFSLERKTDFSTIPICVEASNNEDLEILLNLGNSISDKVLELDSDKRKQLHLAAVFANNFTNHLYTLSKDILEKKDIPFDLLKPLIKETAKKAILSSPEKVQTGPAVRKDKSIIEMHKKMLEKDPSLQNLYHLLTESIYDKQSHNEEL